MQLHAKAGKRKTKRKKKTKTKIKKNRKRNRTGVFAPVFISVSSNYISVLLIQNSQNA